MTGKKTGILGGTFNPVHFGHLLIGESARIEYGLDRIVFVPTGSPPHKPHNQLADSSHRLRMLEIAVESNPYFEIDTVETERKGTAYTVDTMRYFKNRYVHDQFYFIIGGDTLLELDTWKDFGIITGLCSFIAYYRPGVECNRISRQLDYLENKFNVSVNLLEGPGLDISSRGIRERVSEGKSIRYLVPDGVFNYIEDSMIYGRK